MRQAVIVSTARTPLTKSHRGELNITPGPTLASFAVRAAVDRAGIDPKGKGDDLLLRIELEVAIGGIREAVQRERGKEEGGKVLCFHGERSGTQVGGSARGFNLKSIAQLTLPSRSLGRSGSDPPALQIGGGFDAVEKTIEKKHCRFLGQNWKAVTVCRTNSHRQCLKTPTTAFTRRVGASFRNCGRRGMNRAAAWRWGSFASRAGFRFTPSCGAQA